MLSVHLHNHSTKLKFAPFRVMVICKNNGFAKVIVIVHKCYRNAGAIFKYMVECVSVACSPPSTDDS